MLVGVGEQYLEKRGPRKILAGSRDLGNVFDKSRSLVFSWFAFTFFESRNFSPKSPGLVKANEVTHKLLANMSLVFLPIFLSSSIYYEQML